MGFVAGYGVFRQFSGGVCDNWYVTIALILGRVGVVGMRRGAPLPLVPAGSVVVAPGVDLVEVEEGGVVFVWGRATWFWEAGDVAGRRLAAVQLVETCSGRHGEVAAGFGTDPDTLRRWRRDYREGGVDGLRPAKRGPKGPSILTVEKIGEIVRLRATGSSMAAIGTAVGVSLNSVSRALAAPQGRVVEHGSNREDVDSEDVDGGGVSLVALARPQPRVEERRAARCGVLREAAPVICEGSSLPLAAVLLVLPALAVTGLLEVAEAVYGRARAAFYGLRSLVLTLVFAALWGEARVEGMTRVDPVDAGRVLGLDRAPEVKTIRRRMQALALEHKADRLLGGLAQRHVASHDEAIGVLYVDGHVRAYHGKADVAKGHVARIRLSMPAELDTWIADANGDGLLVWSALPGASLVGELRRVATEVRALVGPDKHPTIAFDRGGWSPTLFAELVDAGFHILTYRKKPCPTEPRAKFSLHAFTDDRGRARQYWLADRRVRIAYRDQNNRQRRFGCRQITRLDPDTGHQTQIVTTRAETEVTVLADAMFSRWRQENFFRYMRAHYALDGLDEYATIADDPARLCANPARKTADLRLREARQQLAQAEATEGRAALAGQRREPNKEIGTAFEQARTEIVRLETAARAIPTRIPLATAHPDAQRLDPERKRIHDAIRLATYNAESALARLLAPHYARADDEARTLLHEIFRSPADLQIIGTELHVTINPLSAPRRTRALAALCTELTATQTIYPGTKLALVYNVKNT